MKWVISGSHPVLSLIGRVWFNCRIFSLFRFIFPNSRQVRVLLFSLRFDYILKIFFIILFYILI